MPYSMVVIGSSWGGFEALQVLLGSLPGDFPLPIAIAQHRDIETTDNLPRTLQKSTSLYVRDVVDKDPIQRGFAYLAPADYHLLVEGDYFSLSVDAPVSFSRPSIDVLFESAAAVHGAAVIGVVLTGTGEDGAQGLRAIKERGGLGIVQSPADSMQPAMPAAAIATGAADIIRPLEEIAAALIDLCAVRVRKGA